MTRYSVLKAALIVAMAPALASAPAFSQSLNSLTDRLQGSSSSTQNPLNQLGSSLSIPSIGSGNASGAAGVLQYCVQNNYLSGNAATSVKDQLLQKAGVSSSDQQYRQGSQGLLSGNGGQSLNLSSLKGQVAKKACESVLSNARSFL